MEGEKKKVHKGGREERRKYSKKKGKKTQQLSTFLDPANPSDSVKKYAKGMRKTRDTLENKNTRFHNPGRKEMYHG